MAWIELWRYRYLRRFSKISLYVALILAIVTLAVMAETGMVTESFKAELLPAGSRVAVLAHVEHSPAVHELLWGWHREQHDENGWAWLVERLARLEDQTGNSHLA